MTKPENDICLREDDGWCCACHSDPTTSNGKCPPDCQLPPEVDHPCE